MIEAHDLTKRFDGFTALYEESSEDADDEKNVKLPEIKKGENPKLYLKSCDKPVLDYQGPENYADAYNALYDTVINTK